MGLVIRCGWLVSIAVVGDMIAEVDDRIFKASEDEALLTFGSTARRRLRLIGASRAAGLFASSAPAARLAFWFGQGTKAPSTSAGMMPRSLSMNGLPQRQRSVTFRLTSGGLERTVFGGSGHGRPYSCHPVSDGPSTCNRNEYRTGAAGAAGSQTVPHTCLMVSSRYLLDATALGVGSGTQLSSAS